MAECAVHIRHFGGEKEPCLAPVGCRGWWLGTRGWGSGCKAARRSTHMPRRHRTAPHSLQTHPTLSSLQPPWGWPEPWGRNMLNPDFRNSKLGTKPQTRHTAVLKSQKVWGGACRVRGCADNRFGEVQLQRLQYRGASLIRNSHPPLRPP